MTQDEANTYWSTRDFKKWVVTLERGPVRKPEREVKYVGARQRSQAIECARRNALTVKNPSRVGCRLATAYDLGCRPTEASHD